MLYYAGATRYLGNITHGNTVTDFLPLERQRGITIQSAVVTLHWPVVADCPPAESPKSINLIDTPGHTDFAFEVYRAVAELDGAVAILDSTRGVEANTERVWALARQYDVPALFYLNKHDMEGASMKLCVQEMASLLGTFPLVLQIPWWEREAFVGHVDVVREVGIKYSSTGKPSMTGKDKLPPELRDELKKARAHLIDMLAENDEELLEEFSTDENVSMGSIKRSVRKLTLSAKGRFSPVFCGASSVNMGVQPLLDGVGDYLPSPADRPGLEVQLASGTGVLTDLIEGDVSFKGRECRERPFSGIGHVFKVVDDPQRGMICFVRVYYGSLSLREMWNTRLQKSERPLNIMQIFADKNTEIPLLSAGHIGALTGLKFARTGDTLISFAGKTVPESFRDVRIKPPEIPPAVAFISLTPYTKTATDQLQDALSRLSRVDPSLRHHYDQDKGQFILSGLGTMHLEIARGTLKDFYRIKGQDVLIGDIEVEYAETVVEPSGPHHEHCNRVLNSKAGQAGCTVEVFPLEDDDRNVLGSDACFEHNGNIIAISILPGLPAATAPKVSRNATKLLDPATLQQQLLNGATAGLARGPSRRAAPVRKCLVRMTLDPARGDVHATSTPGHVQWAAQHAVRAAVARARGGLLEPFMRVVARLPEAAAAATQHDLTARRGGQVLEVRNLADDVYSAAGAAGAGAGPWGAEGVDLERVYAPPDPYASVHSLRDAPKTGGRTRWVEIVARVPLKDMLLYDEQLRELTGGRKNLTMEPDTLELVTGQRLKALESAM